MPTQDLGLEAYGSDMILLDVADTNFDPNTGLPTNQPLCGAYYMYAGGYVAVGDVFGDPADCKTPTEAMAVGSVDDPNAGLDFWLFTNGYADEGGTIEVDPNLDGQPGVSADDIYRGGYLVNAQAPVSRGNEVAHSTTFIISVDPAVICPGTQCSLSDPPGDGDVDNDCDVDLTDLAVLLSAFEVDASGDTDGDGDTDLTDLARMLTVFDADCGTP